MISRGISLLKLYLYIRFLNVAPPGVTYALVNAHAYHNKKTQNSNKILYIPLQDSTNLYNPTKSESAKIQLSKAHKSFVFGKLSIIVSHFVNSGRGFLYTKPDIIGTNIDTSERPHVYLLYIV